MVAATPGGPADTLVQNDRALRQLLRAPDADKHKDEQKKILDVWLDYDTVVRQSLAEHWDGLKRRDELISVFKQMYQKGYVRQLKTHLADEIEVLNEQIDGDEATVSTLAPTRLKGVLSTEKIVYKMRKVGGAWRVRDIITDEMSLVRNFKTQLHKIITEQGEAKLIEKMKAKL